MTNQTTIQEVLFFPQMRPEAVTVNTVKDEAEENLEFTEAGVWPEWVPVLKKMAFNTIKDLKAANPNKVFNDLGGMRKKLKLEITMPSKDVVISWCS